MVAEDTHVPTSAFRIMFNAVSNGVRATEMHIRKWLQSLINRSLVLGSWERPQLHDVRRLLMRLARRVLRS